VTPEAAAALRDQVRAVPDFPRAGILFRDITPLLGDAGALRATVAALAEPLAGAGVDLVVGAEARGFLLGPALATAIGAGFAPARKPGRLPGTTRRAAYALEYGEDALELHSDAVAPGARVVVHDDLLATGGTAGAMCELVQGAGGEVVAASFVIELALLGGRARLAPLPVHSVIAYED